VMGVIPPEPPSTVGPGSGVPSAKVRMKLLAGVVIALLVLR
jgi:hypothetical protein